MSSPTKYIAATPNAPFGHGLFALVPPALFLSGWATVREHLQWQTAARPR